jgi:hypothetical protein
LLRLLLSQILSSSLPRLSAIIATTGIIYEKPRKQQEGESKSELLMDVVVIAKSIAGAIADYEEHNMDLIVIGRI